MSVLVDLGLGYRFSGIMWQGMLFQTTCNLSFAGGLKPVSQIVKAARALSHHSSHLNAVSVFFHSSPLLSALTFLSFLSDQRCLKWVVTDTTRALQMYLMNFLHEKEVLIGGTLLVFVC